VHSSGPLDHVHVLSPGLDVTVYEVTAAPLAAAASHDTVARRTPADALTPDGAPGTAASTTTCAVPTEGSYVPSPP